MGDVQIRNSIVVIVARLRIKISRTNLDNEGSNLRYLFLLRRYRRLVLCFSIPDNNIGSIYL